MHISSISFLVVLLILDSITNVSPMHQQSYGNDGLCRSISHVLCVETQLLSITKTAKAILRSINETIEAIPSSHGTETCNDNHNQRSRSPRPYTPSSELHDTYVAHNNINGSFLNQLLLEGHNALSYYFKSISTLCQDRVIFDEKSYRGKLEEIQAAIRENMICPYRNVLYTSSQPWPWISQIGQMEYSRRRRFAPSQIHAKKACALLHHLRKWMEKIGRVLGGVRNKLH